MIKINANNNEEAKRLIGDTCNKIINDLHVMVEQDDKLGRQIIMKNIMNRFNTVGNLLNQIDSEEFVNHDINEVLSFFETES